MAVPESPITAPQINEITKQLEMLTDAQRSTHAATLAAAVITAMGRPVSVAEAIEINQDVYFSFYRGHQPSRHQEWMKTKAEQLARIRD